MTHFRGADMKEEVKGAEKMIQEVEKKKTK